MIFLILQKRSVFVPHPTAISIVWSYVQLNVEKASILQGDTAWPDLKSRRELGVVPCGLFYMWITVPLFPSMASGAFSREAMMALRPFPLFTKFMAACTLGSMLPGAN